MFQFAIVVISFLSIAFHATGALAQSSDTIVELIVSVPGAASEEHQRWAEILADVGADRMRIVSADEAKPGISESEFRGQTILTIHGVLSRNGQLALPGGSFSAQDSQKIRDLISTLRVDGAVVTLSEKMAFGLTAEQLVGVNDLLAGAIDFETKDQRIRDVVAKIQQSLEITLIIDPTARTKLATDEIVQEEMNGLSKGTVLAAAIRPLGLVLVPGRLVGKTVELKIADSRSASEHWPIGWPIELSPAKTAPGLFERFNFELYQAPLTDALAAIEKKTKTPLLFDHNALAREGIELPKVKVTFQKKKQTYFSVIDDLLSQTRPRLRLEIRVDEAQRPFLWISTAVQR